MLKLCLLGRLFFMVPLICVVVLFTMEPIKADQAAGTAIPAESRPCVDCHAFEFMQRALQDLKKTAYNLDTRIWEHIFRDWPEDPLKVEPQGLNKKETAGMKIP